MTSRKISNHWSLAASATGLGLLVALSTCLGVFAGFKLAGQNGRTDLSTVLQLKAGTASRGKSISMATGLIDGDVEGLFVLDHLSGNLQCWVMNSKTGEVGGIYRTNVVADLAAAKAGEPDYVMTTGNFFWSGGNTGNLAPAQSIVYVADGATGNVVGYSLTYDKQGIRRGVVQAGLLTLVCKGPARELVTRDQ